MLKQLKKKKRGIQFRKPPGRSETLRNLFVKGKRRVP
jgi:hypothetical protein